jgi:signal transduction histidine kinase
MVAIDMSRTPGDVVVPPLRYRWYWPHVPDVVGHSPTNWGINGVIYIGLPAVFALPWVERATGISWVAMAAIMVVHASWIAFSAVVLNPRIRTSRRAFDAMVVGNVVFGVGLASLFPVLANAPHSVLWGALILYGTMNGSLAELEPSIPILGLNIIGPLATIPYFLADYGAWAIAGPVLAACFSAAGYHLAASFGVKGVFYQRAAAAAQRQASDMRLARDLHDVVGSTLGSVKIYADLMAPKTPIGNVAQSGLDDLRAVLDALSPPREGGLEATLAALLHRLVPEHIETRVTGAWPTELPSNVRVAAARVTQEAIYNALRHGQPSKIEIEGAYEHGKVSLRIRDNGRGFDVDTAMKTGRGLTTMRSRIEELAGMFTITSGRSGTCVDITILLQERKAA